MLKLEIDSLFQRKVVFDVSLNSVKLILNMSMLEMQIAQR